MLHILNVAQTGLRASQTQVENVMNNIANENVAGYKKRVVNTSEIEHADSRITGRGIAIDSVSRTTQVYMYKNLIEENAKLNTLKELDTTLADLEAIFKETDTAGLSAELNNYFKAIENLRTTPHYEIYKNNVANSAKGVILELQKLYESVERKEDSMIKQTKEVVGKVNSMLREIGRINEKILKSTYGTPNDLLDKRDALEKDLSQYIDVDISRDELYELKIAGATAVRFSTNVREVQFVKDYIPQQDVYAKVDSDGYTLTNGINGDYVSSVALDDTDAIKAEEQTLKVRGTVNSSAQVRFLDTVLSVAAGSNGTTVASTINSNKATVIADWNENHPDNKIDTISVSGDEVTIKYQKTEGDMPALPNASSNGIDFTGSLEKQKGLVDSLTYTLDGTYSIRVTIGEIITDASGTPVDFDSSGNGGKVTHENIIQALVYQINQNKDIGGKITAYNGKYELDEKGHKILTSETKHSKYEAPGTSRASGFADRYLVVESDLPGEDGGFVGELLVNEADSSKNTRHFEARNEYVSKDAVDNIHLEIYNKEITVSGGSLKPLTDNIKTDSGSNLIHKYKKQLDIFARKLVDLTSSYIENSNQTYVYGNTDVNESYDADKAVNINLFHGASVKTIEFNERSLYGMTQEKLDYLADLQWKENIDFDGTGENIQSFSEFYQTLRVTVAGDREGVVFKKNAQEAVKEALQSNYDNVVKVDKDEELMELIKFQKAYEASAKIVTVVDEMLEALLAMKR